LGTSDEVFMRQITLFALMKFSLVDKLRFAKFNRFELSGSLGDMGTFIPLLVGMTTKCGLDVASALFFAGFFNAVTGMIFTIPMAVQPMKAIATVAISEGLTVQEILAAGIITSAVILFLGITNLIEWANRYIPKSVVRGLQLGLGLKLLMSGIGFVADTRVFLGYDSILTGILCFVLVLLLFFSKRIPGALVIFLIGIVLVFFKMPSVFSSLQLGFSVPNIVHIGQKDFVNGFLKGTVAQIPLTLLNSVIAVSALSFDLFPERGAKNKNIAISVGMMNLISCWFGAMPMCHGAGGLAGQYRFGARTNGSIIFLGIIKMAIAVVLGKTVFDLLVVYPNSVLGILLLFSGLELAMVVRDMRKRSDYFVVLLTAGANLALNSTALGFVIGLVLAYILSSTARLTKMENNNL